MIDEKIKDRKGDECILRNAGHLTYLEITYTDLGDLCIFPRTWEIGIILQILGLCKIHIDVLLLVSHAMHRMAPAVKTRINLFCMQKFIPK